MSALHSPRIVERPHFISIRHNMLPLFVNMRTMIIQLP